MLCVAPSIKNKLRNSHMTQNEAQQPFTHPELEPGTGKRVTLRQRFCNHRVRMQCRKHSGLKQSTVNKGNWKRKSVQLHGSVCEHALLFGGRGGVGHIVLRHGVIYPFLIHHLV